ncbi:MAG: hypothetical protein Q8Q12_11415 [bacterium]|nr:hypothetical protein [bacterium]
MDEKGRGLLKTTCDIREIAVEGHEPRRGRRQQGDEGLGAL